MSQHFDRTVRSLNADDPTRVVLGVVGVALLAAVWITWLFFTQTWLYAQGQQARIEVSARSHEIHSPVGATIKAKNITLGRSVSEGELLVQLDAAPLRIELSSARRELAGLRRDALALDVELERHRSLMDAVRSLRSDYGSEDSAQREHRRVALDYASKHAERLGRLESEGYESTEAVARAKRDEKALRMLRGVDRAKSRVTQGETEVRLRTLETQDAHLARQRGALESQIDTQRATIESLVHRIELHSIRAPIDGVIGSFSTAEVGSVLAPGDPVAVVVPEGTLIAVTELPAESVAGRVRPGQSARLELSGHGRAVMPRVELEVTRVGQEPNAEGLVRVELSIVETPPVGLSHGMAGTIDIRLERTTPFALLLRALDFGVEAAP